MIGVVIPTDEFLRASGLWPLVCVFGWSVVSASSVAGGGLVECHCRRRWWGAVVMAGGQDEMTAMNESV